MMKSKKNVQHLNIHSLHSLPDRLRDKLSLIRTIEWKWRINILGFKTDGSRTETKLELENGREEDAR